MLRVLCLIVVAFLGLLACDPTARPSAAADAGPRVVLVMIDGLRWQEVFRGATDALLTKERGLVEDAATVLARFGGQDAEARREALMPFFWSTIAKEGQVWGNRDQGSNAECTNGRFVSYPGYSETICGFVDPAIEGNDKIVNPNRNAFEWLASLDDFRGRVAIFGCWDVFPYIFGSQRNGLPVDDGIAPFVPPSGRPPTPVIDTVNRLRAEVPMRWKSAHFDAMLAPVAFEWMRMAAPRAVFIALGETDEWAHEGDYARYLEAAHRADAYLAELWRLIQSTPGYRDQTTLIVTTDHGRGSDDAGPREWNNHNARAIGSHQIWMAILGPGTPALGCVSGGPLLEQAQIAATLAHVVGLDWPATEPRAKPPIREAIAMPRPINSP